MHLKISRFLWAKKYLLLLLFFFLILITQRFFNITQTQSGLANSIASDGNGYYAYLPAAIIYQDFNYDFYNKKENNINSIYNLYPHEYKGKYHLNKYYCGTAICLLPFFLLGIIISAIAGTDINGYTDTFLMLVSIAPIIYYLIGTFLLTRIARFLKVPEKTSFWISLIFFFSTNLFHYVLQEPSMSHAYSFFAVTMFFYFFICLIQNITTRNIIYLSLSLGLVTLIRPPNFLILLFIPFFFSSITDCISFFKELIKKHFLKLAIALLTFIITICLQLLFYYFQTGDFIVESYPGETFNFSHPEIFNIFFSYKKGLFLYTPIIFFALIIIFVGKSNWFKRSVFIICFSTFVYITSSWWCWYYGGGFSGRTFIDIYPIFIIILMYLFTSLNRGMKKLIVIICVPFVFVNQVMAYQYSHRIIKEHEMTEARYKGVFLKTSTESANSSLIRWLLKNRKIIYTHSESFEEFEPKEYIINEGFKSSCSYVFGDKFPFSYTYKITRKDLKVDATKLFYIVAECKLKPENNNEKATLVISMNDKDAIVKWDVVFDSQFKEEQNDWKTMMLIAEVESNLLTKDGSISVFTNKLKGYNLVDNLKCTIIQ